MTATGETRAPANLAELRVIADPGERALAATAYVEARERAIVEARKVRAEAVLELVATEGVAAAARRSGLSDTTVRGIRIAAGQLRR